MLSLHRLLPESLAESEAVDEARGGGAPPPPPHAEARISGRPLCCDGSV
jgi:hypothetical protein